MQVGILPAAPLPGGVKVARRLVKPFGVGASPTLAAKLQSVLSAADGLAWNEEVAGATPATLTILWKAGHFKPSTQRNPIMTTILQYVPKWLRVRLQKPAQPKPRNVSKKDRQILPTLPDQSRSVIFSPDDSRPGYRLLWRL